MTMQSATSQHYRDGLLDTNIPIRAVNNNAEPVVWWYANAKYTLLPGQPTFVPYLAMCFYQGDPRAIDHPGDDPATKYRRNEYAELRIRCGVYENDAAWDTCPHMHIVCYPIDSDVPFNTVIRDPEGVNQAEARADSSEQSFLRNQMESMAAQMRVMQAQLAAKEFADAALTMSGIDPADLDRQVTTSKAISPEEAVGESMVGQHPVQKSGKARPKAGEGPAVTQDN